MASAAQKPYPGDVATPRQILGLADEYRSAAEILLTAGRRGDRISRAPYRLTAIHAIELYLNAFLLAQGHGPCEVRALQHDLAARARLAIACGLILRKRTARHLESISETREYLITRYGPEIAAVGSELNRLSATLAEVASKVTARISPGLG